MKLGGYVISDVQQFVLRPCNLPNLESLIACSHRQVFSNPQYIWDWTVANCKLGRDKTTCLL